MKAKVIDGAIPHKCVLLAIDPGAVSGSATFVRGELVSFSDGAGAALREATARSAAMQAYAQDLPLLVVMEEWGGRFASWKTAIGIGAARGAWEQAIELAGVRPDHVVRMHVQTWRSRAGIGKRIDANAYKRAAQAIAKSIYRVNAGQNAAEAIVMGHVALRSSEAEAMLKKLGRARNKAA